MTQYTCTCIFKWSDVWCEKLQLWSFKLLGNWGKIHKVPLYEPDPYMYAQLLRNWEKIPRSPFMNLCCIHACMHTFSGNRDKIPRSPCTPQGTERKFPRSPYYEPAIHTCMYMYTPHQLQHWGSGYSARNIRLCHVHFVSIQRTEGQLKSYMRYTHTNSIQWTSLILRPLYFEAQWPNYQASLFISAWLQGSSPHTYMDKVTNTVQREYTCTCTIWMSYHWQITSMLNVYMFTCM